MDMEKLENPDEIDRLAKQFTHAHLLCCFPNHALVYPTHSRLVVDSKTKWTLISGIRDYKFYPSEYGDSEARLFSRCYRLVTECVSDKVFERSLDRFCAGRKKYEHSPNALNTPNLDKVLDYIVALEALLLSEEGSELSYRFKLNGAWLLSEAVGIDRKMLFKCLGHLYNMRSFIVHGYDIEKAMKQAQKLRSLLTPRSESSSKYLDDISSICCVLEKWLRDTFLHLVEMKRDDRPHNRKEAWVDKLLGLNS